MNNRVLRNWEKINRKRVFDWSNWLNWLDWLGIGMEKERFAVAALEDRGAVLRTLRGKAGGRKTREGGGALRLRFEERPALQDLRQEKRSVRVVQYVRDVQGV